jgi:phosphoglycolate phosphatase
MNTMLKIRRLPTIDIRTYKEVFSFPVIDYYEKIGFDFRTETFEELSIEFIDAYSANISSAKLVSGAEQLLGLLKDNGKENVIISAMKQEMLLRSVEERGILTYFRDIRGIGDIYAASKTSLAQDYVSDRGLSSGEILLIGDTTHDLEVAQAIGARCILIADGHQSEERLRATGAEVIPAFKELLPYILPKSL